MYDPNYLQAEITYRRDRIKDGIVGHRRRALIRQRRAEIRGDGTRSAR